MHVIAACRVKNTCAPEHATYSIGLGREGIDLAIDRSIRRSWIRCCRRPGPDLLVVQHGVDHTRCVASLTSPLYHSFPYPSPPSILPLPLLSLLSLRLVFSPLSAWFCPEKTQTLTSIPPPRCSPSSLSLPRPIARSFFLSFSLFLLFFSLHFVSCTRVRKKERWKVRRRVKEERIKYWILLLAVSYLSSSSSSSFFLLDLCNFVPLWVTRVSTLPADPPPPPRWFCFHFFSLLFSLSRRRVKMPLDPLPLPTNLSLGMLFIRIRVSFSPRSSIFLLWSLKEGISISRDPWIDSCARSSSEVAILWRIPPRAAFRGC